MPSSGVVPHRFGSEVLLLATIFGQIRGKFRVVWWWSVFALNEVPAAETGVGGGESVFSFEVGTMGRDFSKEGIIFLLTFVSAVP
jgi:hypothetical protein